MIVVSNTTPLSELAKISRLDLLQSLFNKILIPPDVYAELTTGNHPAATAIPAAMWIEVQTLSYPSRVEQLLQMPELDQGECAAIALAEELRADLLLIDEQAGRQLALQLGIPMTGTVGVLLTAKQIGLIAAIRPLVDALIAEGKWISPGFYQQILQLANE